jgi:hypothetical protein
LGSVKPVLLSTVDGQNADIGAGMRLKR